MAIKNKFLNSISDIPVNDFKENLNGYRSPFMSYEFLDALRN